MTKAKQAALRGLNLLNSDCIQDILAQAPLLNNRQDIVAFLPESVSDLEVIKKRVFALSLQELEKIFTLPNQDRTFLNTAFALDQVQAFFSIFSSLLFLVKNTFTDEKMRHEAQKIKNEFSTFYIENIASNRKVYEALNAYISEKKSHEALDEQEEYFLEDVIRDFKKAGFHLSENDFQAVSKLKKELALLENEFSKNVNEDKSQVIIYDDQLEGLDEDFLKSLEKKDNQYIVYTDYPSYFYVMRQAKSQALRKAFYLAFSNRAYPQNESVLKQVIEKRQQMSVLLGYSSYAQYDIDGQMAQSPEVVESFIQNLVPKIRQKAQNEFKDLIKDLPDFIELNEKGQINPWDLLYLSNNYKKQHFEIDEKQLSEYFPLEKTIKGLFDIYEQFFGFEFHLCDDVKLWHPDVKLMEILDKESRKSYGFIALDLFPREGKYTHACSSAIIPPLFVDQGWAPAWNLVIGNFTKPSQEKPALLQFDEVNTFFHEMGHAIHALMGRAKMPSFAGYCTKMDFVELPSQLLEEWLWEEDILKDLSSHYLTGKNIDQPILQKKIQSKNFDTGRAIIRQLVFTQLSLQLFKDGDPNQVNKLFRELSAKWVPEVALDPENHFESSFGHLMGYGSKYYSYLWAKVFALDVFETIKTNNGLLNAQEGKKYIKEILSKGGGVDPNQLMQNYLQRKPSQKAFLKDMGIEEE